MTLARQTLTNWTGRAIDLLEPVRGAQWESILESRVIAMDETAIRAGRTGPGKMRSAKLWPVFGDRSELVFHYAPDRAHRRVPEILGEFSGVLLSDGYQAYEQYARRPRGNGIRIRIFAVRIRKPPRFGVFSRSRGLSGGLVLSGG